MFNASSKLIELIPLTLPRGSIKLIAKKLSLATLTVSNCLRNKPYYSKATKIKVLKEAKSILENDIKLKQAVLLQIERLLQEE